jgi:hypothetical protein
MIDSWKLIIPPFLFLNRWLEFSIIKCKKKTYINWALIMGCALFYTSSWKGSRIHHCGGFILSWRHPRINRCRKRLSLYSSYLTKSRAFPKKSPVINPSLWELLLRRRWEWLWSLEMKRQQGIWHFINGPCWNKFCLPLVPLYVFQLYPTIY